MSAKRIFLTAVMMNRDGKRVWTGEYACSLCGQRFRPDLTDPGKLTSQFEEHRDRHTSEPETSGEISRS